MRANLLLCGILLCAGIAFNSCKPSDEKLQKEVTAGLNTVSSDLSGKVEKGQVTLTGIVESDEAKTNAEKVTSAIKGIKSVVNNIEVKKPEPVINPDDVLKSTIAAAITAAGDAFKKVMVEVKGGEVTLTGEIKKVNLQKVLQIANEAKPKKVNNQLNIK
jgi:osmotically-inducible protein OsmY